MKHVAVVMKPTGEDNSLRALGDWSAFVGTDRDEVVNRAIDASREWMRNRPDRNYSVFVGTLVAAVKPVHEYRLAPISERAKPKTKAKRKVVRMKKRTKRV